MAGLGQTTGALPEISEADEPELKRAYLQERVAKTRADREKVDLQNAITRGEMVARSVAREEAVRCAEVVRVGLRQFENSLPPRVEGLDAAKAQVVIRDAVDELLEAFSDVSDKLWAEAIPQEGVKKSARTGGRRPTK